MLETTANRPLSLLRHPAGLSDQGFFQKHAGDGFPDAIQTVAIPGKDGTLDDYMYVRDAAGLVAAVQMGTIEFHIWGALRGRLERPDRLVFDLDPGPDVGFGRVRQGAVDIRDRLLDLGLNSHAMVTGGKGIHVIVQLRRTTSWETVKIFSHTFAAIMSEQEPDRFTASMSKSRRTGRIFIDWLRNERGATAVAPFSVRARPGARVAVPVCWDELSTLKSADAFDLKLAVERAAQPQVSSPLVSLGNPAVEKLQKWAKLNQS
jgi:bifunctional non-homologous end joining protein LigD